MTPQQIKTANALLEKRRALLTAKSERGPDYTYWMQKQYKGCSADRIFHIEDAEIEVVISALLERVETSLRHLGVDLL